MAAPTVQDPGVYEDGFYEDFDDEEPEVPLGQCSALYSFDGEQDPIHTYTHTHTYTHIHTHTNSHSWRERAVLSHALD